MQKYGEDFAKIWPKCEEAVVLTDFGRRLLTECAQIAKPIFENVTIADVIQKSTSFPVEFGTDSCRIQSQPAERYGEIRKQLSSAYPVIHERVVHLYLRFLEHKSKHANKVERQVFPGLSLTDFVQRMLSKRCVCFYGYSDRYRLVGAGAGAGAGASGFGGFTEVGTENEKKPLVLSNVLSYDEIKLSALLYVSSHSEFINDGNRCNEGVIEKKKSRIETSGVIIGLIGARFPRYGLMEYQDIIITETQNTIANGYGQQESLTETRENNYRQVWKDFYEDRDFLFNQVTVDDERFGYTKRNEIFDNVIMKKRFAIPFDTLLLESESRAAVEGKRAYIHVVGIGLGVWRTASQQNEIFLLTFAERLKVLMPQLNHVAFVNFAWFNTTECGELKHEGILKSETHPDGGIRTFFSNRNPADKLSEPEFENTLLIVSYAWDGNALPGNEFWDGYLSDSGDPAAACSTLITEIHNPHINSEMVSGQNLHVASPKFGLMHISEYSKKVLNLN